MDFSFIRRLVAFTYTLILLLFIGLGFCYTNETNGNLTENTVSFSDYWEVDGKIITFPYSHDSEFTIENTLPLVYGDQMLVIRTYFTDYTVAIDGDEIIESRNHTLFGHPTNVGKKELWIPLKHEYSGSQISVTLKLQHSLYASEITEAFITTRSAYGIETLKKNVPSVILFIVFTVTGIIEICIAGFFILRRAALIRKLTFEALFYAGCFSIVSAQWIINETRIPFILFGYTIGFSILNIIAFLLMPMLFFEMSRALFLRVDKIDNAIDGAIALSIVTGCLLSITGVIDWGSLVYLAHVLILVVMIMVGYYSYTSVRDEKKLSSRTSIAIANFIFLLLAIIALAQYLNNIYSHYILIIIIDLMVYIMVQVGLIYRRIGLNVREEREFAQAKLYAFTDELTGLGNRRHFLSVVDDYEKNKLPTNLTFVAIDVNRLKYFNDQMGHEAGDELLKGTAECMKMAFNTCTTTTLGRLGGDEFAILVVASEADINRRLFNMKISLSKWRGKFINGIDVAVGVASVREDSSVTIDELAKIADERMYEDKKASYESTGYDRRSPL